MIETELTPLALNIASISDIHLGHPRTPTSLICNNMNKYAFPDNKDTAALDIIFIAGDFTDSPQDFASDNAVIIRRWVSGFLRMCAAHDIKVRVLEGTPLHDWGQSKIFVEENENHGIGCDLKYITDIHIEHIQDLGIRVLYIPDEIRPTTQQTWEEVQRLMDEHGLKEVDFAVMHGCFPHQLPDIEQVKDKFHDPEKYQAIVKHNIFIGHIHQFSQLGKIISHGSFDRLAQGEEDTKGHIRWNKGKIEFRPNKGAMRYKSIDVTGDAADRVIEKVIDYLGNDTSLCCIRLVCSRDDVGFSMLRRLTEMFPFAKFDVQATKTKRKETQKQKATRLQTLPILTRDNLVSELLKEIKERSPEHYDQCKPIVEKLAHVVK